MSMNLSTGVAATTTIDPWLTLIVGACGAAALTVAGGLIGAWIQSIREHRKWLRERRHEAYLDFMVVMSKISALAKIDGTPENAAQLAAKLAALSDDLIRAGDAVSILGPRAVNAAGQDWVGAATASIGDRSEAKSNAVSRGRWRFLIAVGKELKSKNVGAVPPEARRL